MNLPRLLPTPRRIEPGDGGPFLPNAATQIVLPPNASDIDIRAAEVLRDGTREAIALSLAIVETTTGAHHANVILFASADGADGDLATLGPQGFRLTIDVDGARIASVGEPGRFYGALALAQVAAESGRCWPALLVEDAPALPTRGFMLDVSRGRVPTPDSLVALADGLARLRYNHLQLYVEHAFAFPGHEEIGAGYNPLTPDDVRVLDRACRERHIELVPNLQALGHQPRLFALPRYAHLSETAWPWSFAVANDGSAALLGELFDGMLPAFSSNLVNVNADEPWDIGRGQSAALAAEEGYAGVYLRHLLTLHGLLAARGKRMAMWADMFWHHADVAARLPADVLFLDWWYEAKDDYPSVQVLAEAGREFWVCPATSSWSSLFPRLENAVANIEGFVRAGLAAGATGMLLTEWGDGGHFQPPTHATYPIAWGAECGWSGGPSDRAAFDEAFSRHVLHDGSGRQVAALRRLGAAMQADPNWTATWHSGMALFEDPLSGRQWSVAAAEVVAEAREAALALSPLLAEVGDPAMRRDLSQAVAQVLFATTKVETTRAIRGLLVRLAAPGGTVAEAPPHRHRERVEGSRPSLGPENDEIPRLARDDVAGARTDDAGARDDATGELEDGSAARDEGDSATDSDPAGLATFDALLAALRDARARIPALAAEFEANWHEHSRRSGIGQTLDRYAALERRYDAALAWLGEQRAALLAGGPIDAGLAGYDRGGYTVLQEDARHMVLELAAVVGHDRLPDDLKEFLDQTAVFAEDRA